MLRQVVLVLWVLFAPASLWADPTPPLDSYREFTSASDRELLNEISKMVREGATPTEKDLLPKIKASSLPERIWGVALVLYEPGKERILALRHKGSAAKDMIGAAKAVRAHKRFGSFAATNPEVARLQVDFILNTPQPFDLYSASMSSLDARRFEFGVDGLEVRFGDKKLYHLPGDSFVKSILGLGQLARYLTKALGNKPTDRLEARSFRTLSYVSFKKEWLPLFRGYPVSVRLTRDDIRQAAEKGAQHLLDNQDQQGRFLYYYDVARDSRRDHEHIQRDPDKNPYYNYVRHAGAMMALLKYYELRKDPKILARTRLGLWYALRELSTYALPDGREASFLVCNNKGKLGGSGVLLHVLAEYQHLSKDETFAPAIERLSRHLLAEILPSGEFRYYRTYLGKIVPPEENSKYFGFYYPGEAVTGLATVLQHTLGTPQLRKEIGAGLEKAIRYLIVERPKQYGHHFASLPHDSWLIMGLARLQGVKEFRTPLIEEFVFRTADQMVRQMYTRDDGLFPDYAGAFYYTYGDHPYPDAARGEGLVAAMQFAERIGNLGKAKLYQAATISAARAMYLLVNTEESTYSAPNPTRAIGGIRFKMTRQWFRIDTIAHAANVFFDIAPRWSDSKPTT